MPDLGNHVRDYGTDKTTYFILVAVAAINAMATVFTLYSVLSRYNAPPGILDEMGFGASARKDGLVTGGILAVFSGLVATGCVLAARFQNSVKLQIFENGMISFRGKRNQQAEWKDVVRVVEHRFDSMTHSSNVRRRSTRYYVNVHTKNQELILLRGIKNVRQAGKAIAERCGLEIEHVRD